jgi:hypothetical protein
MWLVKSRTVVKDAWLQGELDTGDRSKISRAAAANCKASDRRVNRLRAILNVRPDCPCLLPGIAIRGQSVHMCRLFLREQS